MDNGFERRLTDAVRARLDQGQDREAIAAELGARLDPARVEAILEQASRPTPARAPGAWTDRLLLGLALLWCLVLLLQNFAVIFAGLEGLGGAPVQGELGAVLVALTVLAGLKLLALGAGAALVLARRTPGRIAVLTGVVAYAFPVGPLIEGAILNPAGADPAILISPAALVAYAAIAVLAALWVRARKSQEAAVG